MLYGHRQREPGDSGIARFLQDPGHRQLRVVAHVANTVSIKCIRMGVNHAVRLDQPLLQRRHQHQRFNGRTGFERIANSPVTKIVNCRAFPVIGVKVRVTRHGEYFAGWDIDQYRCP